MCQMVPEVRLLIDTAAIQNEGSTPKLTHLNYQAVFHPCARIHPHPNGSLQLEAAALPLIRFSILSDTDDYMSILNGCAWSSD
jgi:hypothetical protein